MAEDNNEFTPDELKDFEGVTPEDRAKLEKYFKWLGQKESREAKDKVPSPGSLENSEIDLPILRKLLKDPTALSILDHLRANPDQSRKKEDLEDKTKKPKLARFL